MERQPEPELMNDEAQAAAYAAADFEQPHRLFIELLSERCDAAIGGSAADLGCGPCDITVRCLRRFPRLHFDAIDGAAVMLDLGRIRLRQEGLAGRARLIEGLLPRVDSGKSYELMVSNSLLHHMAQPMDLWHWIKRHALPMTRIFIMDLLRPATIEDARALVENNAAGEPELLRRDFYHSLLAAYRPSEIDQQLRTAGLAHLRSEVVSDRHWIVWGHVS